MLTELRVRNFAIIEQRRQFGAIGNVEGSLDQRLVGSRPDDVRIRPLAEQQA